MQLSFCDNIHCTELFELRQKLLIRVTILLLTESGTQLLDTDVGGGSSLLSPYKNWEGEGSVALAMLLKGCVQFVMQVTY